MISLTGGRRAYLARVRAIERQAAAVILRALRGLGQILSPTEWAMATMTGAPPSEVWRLIAERMRALHADLTATLTRGALIEAEFREQTTVGELAARQIGDLIRGIETQALFAVRQQLAAIADAGVTPGALRAIGQATGLTPRQLQQVTNAYRASLDAGIASGLDAQRAAEMAGRAASGVRERLLDYRARSIARTETVRLVNDVVHERGIQIVAAGGQVMHQWVSSRDAHVDSGNPLGPCRINDNGERIPLTQAFPSGDVSPPAHPFCLPGFALVASRDRVAAQTERWYDGEVVVIRTAGAKKLTATPNHPILTNHGWVAAGALDESHDLICDLPGEWHPPRDDDDQLVPTRIEEVADALGEARKMGAVEVPTAAEDFHGDGEGSKVAVIRSDRLLGNGADTGLREQNGEAPFGGRLSSAHLHGRGAAHLLTHRLPAPPYRTMSGNDLAGALRSGHATPFESLGLGLSANHHTGAAQAVVDHDPRDAELMGQIVDRIARAVAFDQVVGVERYAFHGPVFNLQTDGGLYIAEGIYVKNCRCLEEIWVDQPAGVPA